MIIVTMVVEPEEVELLVSPPTQAPGKRMHGGASSLLSLEKKVQFSELCQKAFFQHLVTAGNMTKKINRIQTTYGEQLLLCVENIRVVDLIRKP